MCVLVHIRAVARGRAVEVHRLYEMMFHQRIKAVVNRGHRKIRFLLLGVQKHFVRRRMIQLIEQHAIHHLPLSRRPQPRLDDATAHHPAIAPGRNKDSACFDVLHSAASIADGPRGVNSI